MQPTVPTATLSLTAPGAASAAAPAAATAGAALPAHVAVGTSLSARVLGVGGSGTLLLRIAGQVFQAANAAATALDVQAGQSLRLQVARLTPVPEFRVLGMPPQAGAVATALRSALPLQQPVSRALDSVSVLARELASPDRQGGVQALSAQLRGILQTRLDVQQLADPALLRTRVQSSGTFLESTLAALVDTSRGPSMAGAQQVLSSDLKAQLLSLRDALRSLAEGGGSSSRPGSGAATLAQALPQATARELAGAGQGASQQPGAGRNAPSMSNGVTGPAEGGPVRAEHAGAAAPRHPMLEPARQVVEGGLARIEVNQVLSARSQGETDPIIHVDLPVHCGGESDDVRMVFSRTRRGADEQPVWKVCLDIAPPGLGPIAVQVSLSAGAISSSLVAERDLTRARLDAGLPELAQALHDAGLTVAALNARQGTLDPPGAGDLPSLVSVKA